MVYINEKYVTYVENIFSQMNSNFYFLLNVVQFAKKSYDSKFEHM